ncbi:MAG: maleylpyruvate isomerase N-terminal domain-containing protein [Acidimicrobiales bacterium]
MERGRCLEVLETQCQRIITILEDPAIASDAAVPTCPGWTLGHLGDHLAAVYTWAAAVLEAGAGATGPPERDQLQKRPMDKDVAEWLAERLDILVAALGETPAGALCWNFVEGRAAPVKFWWRRQMHETLIHRVDAELTATTAVSDAPSDIGADGISEFLEVAGFGIIDWQEIQLGDAMTLHLHAIDAGPEAEWTVDTANRTYARAHLKADIALRGPAWSLQRWCWRRGSLGGAGDLSLGDAVQAFGDWEAAETWRPTR